MSRFFFGSHSRASSVASAVQSDKSLTENELRQLESALADADLIMNDDVETAEKNLEKGDSPFHVLGRGIVAFLQAALGVEQDVMKLASERLNTAESVAQEHQKRAQRDPRAHSVVYPPGTEFAVCQAQAQILGAIICVMNESLGDAIRGFYKLRKALAILESVATHEKQYLEKMGDSDAQEAIHGDQTAVKSDRVKQEGADESQEGDDEFYEANESTRETAPEAKEVLAHAEQETQTKAVPDETAAEHAGGKSSFSHPIDRWIQSTTSSQYGMMLTLISMVPPAFGRLLSIVGFNGDRDRGLALLWRATAHKDINGAVAGLVLLAYLNGLVSFIDIQPPSFYPEARMKALLATMRARYPQSELWRLEEARMQSAGGNIAAAVAILGVHDGPLGEPATDGTSSSGASERKTMKQVLALQTFDRALNSLYIHAHALAARCFQRVCELNNWSLALFNYIIASSHLELYRVHRYGGLLPRFSADAAAPVALDAVPADAALAEQHAAAATRHYEKVPGLAGKKRMFSRQLPFDVFVARKLQKWQARAAAWGVPLVDAVGGSPVEEIIFFFGGYARMPAAQLELSLARLAWCDGDAALLAASRLGVPPAQAVPAPNPHAAREALDEHAVLAVLRAAVLRALGRAGDARALLLERVVRHARAEFAVAKHGENWTAPMARYELAAGYWSERFETTGGGESAGPEVRDEGGSVLNREKLQECAKWLDEVSKWGSFDLDVRIGIKITTGKATLKKLGIEA